MNKLAEKFKAIKHKEIILAVVAVAVMLVIYFSSFGSAKKTEQPTSSTDYCSSISREIEDALGEMNGVGRASVVINWSSSVEVVTAQDTTTNGNSTSSRVVMGSGEPIVLKEIYPKAVGVLIICEGGDNAKVKIEIVMAISTLLDISPDKVLVFGKSK